MLVVYDTKGTEKWKLTTLPCSPGFPGEPGTPVSPWKIKKNNTLLNCFSF